MSHGCPPKCTGIIAFVFGVIRRAVSSGSKFIVSGSISTSTARADYFARRQHFFLSNRSAMEWHSQLREFVLQCVSDRNKRSLHCLSSTFSRCQDASYHGDALNLHRKRLSAFPADRCNGYRGTVRQQVRSTRRVI